ncbi:palmitoyltransferase ZDHHC19-like isoform X2 [Ictidomys tridecemlineatus]
MFLKYLRSFLLNLGAEPRGRALAQNGEWAYPVVSGLLCLLSLYSLIGMNFSDPGILHRGAFKQDPETVYMARVNGRLYHMPWCPTCYFHRLPRTFHCKRCDICVEEFDHHCRWVNNCVGRRNIRLYLLLLVSLCLYLGTVLATCVVFIICRRNVAFLDKIMTYPHTPKGAHWEVLMWWGGRGKQPSRVRVTGEGLTWAGLEGEVTWQDL